MGNRIAAFLLRPIRDFNVENRAHRIISSEKPKAAPRHPTEAKFAAKAASVPEILGEKPDHLERLKGVKVVSSDVQPEETQGTVPPAGKSTRPLPHISKSPPQPEFGYHEPAVTPSGRITLRHATQMISDAAMDPQKWSAEALAMQFSLKKQDVEDILKYFRVYKVHVPKVDLPLLGKQILGITSMRQMVSAGKSNETRTNESASPADSTSEKTKEKG
ncbi:protein NDUFAF4 homolog [Ornithodoros turicata]|uniref:NADH dehydrogenase [ubiquinone] 1 alpha subcomplex assembly factor 4 n=1 Tax=Ornithodoros turicata TaxID=34597 RepID=A0A2R5LHH5_9ACAR